MAGFCPKCGAARLDDARNCTNCGHTFAVAEQTAEKPEPGDGITGPFPKRAQRYGLIGVGLLALAGGGAWLLSGSGGSIFGHQRATDTSLIPVAFGGKCGYVDNSGKIAINPQFDDAQAFFARYDVAPVVVAGKFGLIDRNGKYVVNPQFDGIGSSLDEPAIRVRLGAKWGTIDKEGKFVINPQFDALSEFDVNGVAVATINGKNGVVGLDGKFIVPPTFDSINIYYASQLRSETGGVLDYLARPLQVRRDTKYGFIDSKGNTTIPFQFVNEEDFDDSGLAAAAMEVTDTAAVEQQREQRAAAIVAEANAAANAAQGMPATGAATVDPAANPIPPTKTAWGYIDRNGKFLINPQFDWGGHFGGSGLAPVKVSGKPGDVGAPWGYIDQQAKFSINPQFGLGRSFIKSAGEWFAVVSNIPAQGQKAQWGLIDKAGAYRINPQFDDLSDFSPDGRALAKTGELWGIVDTSGKFLAQPLFLQLIRVHGSKNYIFVKAGDEPDGKMREIGLMAYDGKVLFSTRGEVCPGIATFGP